MYLTLSLAGIVIATIAGFTGVMPVWLAVLSIASIDAYLIHRAFLSPREL